MYFSPYYSLYRHTLSFITLFYSTILMCLKLLLNSENCTCALNEPILYHVTQKSNVKRYSRTGGRRPAPFSGIDQPFEIYDILMHFMKEIKPTKPPDVRQAAHKPDWNWMISTAVKIVSVFIQKFSLFPKGSLAISIGKTKTL